jgi:hypothetical protein
MRKIIFAFALAAAATPLLAAVPADFGSARDILAAPVSSPRLVEVRLDAPLVAATRPDFRDLRLFDNDLQEIPRAIEPLFTTQERIARRPVAATPATLQEIPGNRIETRLDIAPEEPSPDGFEIRTPLADFIRTVRVSGSDDGQFWRPLVEAEIYDYTRYMDIRRTEIILPKNSCRHFTIEISDASEERAQPLVRLVQSKGQEKSRALDLLQTPFRIAEIAFWRDEPVLDKDKTVLQEWPHAGRKVSKNREAKTTEIVLQTYNAPITRLDIETPARNFQRLATVQVPDFSKGRKSWRTVSDGRLINIDLPGLATNDLTLHFPEQRVEAIRLVIQNADNPFLDVTDVRPYGPVYRLLWLAEPAAAYRLAIGSDKLDPPSYDLFAIRAALAKGLEPELWQLGESAIPDPSRRSFSLGEFVSRPAVFGTLLALAAAALLVLLAQALKKAA